MTRSCRTDTRPTTLSLHGTVRLLALYLGSTGMIVSGEGWAELLMRVISVISVSGSGNMVSTTQARVQVQSGKPLQPTSAQQRSPRSDSDLSPHLVAVLLCSSSTTRSIIGPFLCSTQ